MSQAGRNGYLQEVISVNDTQNPSSVLLSAQRNQLLLDATRLMTPMGSMKNLQLPKSAIHPIFRAYFAITGLSLRESSILRTLIHVFTVSVLLAVTVSNAAFYFVSQQGTIRGVEPYVYSVIFVWTYSYGCRHFRNMKAYDRIISQFSQADLQLLQQTETVWAGGAFLLWIFGVVVDVFAELTWEQSGQNWILFGARMLADVYIYGALSFLTMFFGMICHFLAIQVRALRLDLLNKEISTSIGFSRLSGLLKTIKITSIQMERLFGPFLFVAVVHIAFELVDIFTTNWTSISQLGVKIAVTLAELIALIVLLSMPCSVTSQLRKLTTAIVGFPLHKDWKAEDDVVRFSNYLSTLNPVFKLLGITMTWSLMAIMLYFVVTIVFVSIRFG